ncbi:MAG: molecular chaperone [Desulfurellales bacterium]|nr:MAG: molecular chaperone [Desulfurellales bacterium]
MAHDIDPVVPSENPDQEAQTSARAILTELDLADKDHKSWHKRAERVLKRYRDERGNEDSELASGKRYNILWSNTNTVAPAIYSRVPKPVVERRFKDRDPIGRLASDKLERVLNFQLQNEDFDHAMVQCREDLLLPGRAITWIRYKPTMGTQLVPVTATPTGEYVDANGAPVDPKTVQPQPDGSVAMSSEMIVDEDVCCDYVHWKDFLHNPARIWSEVRWVARRSYMTRDAVVERFGKEKAQVVTYDYLPEQMDDAKSISQQEQEPFKKAVVWEYWDKTTKTVTWVAKGCDQVLDSKPDPLGLTGYFPCPRPLLSVTTNDTLIPIPYFSQYQDQASELDELTTRISLIASAIRVVGCYDASKPHIGRILKEAPENEMLPVEDWISHSKDNGIKGAVDFMPLEDLQRTLTSLYEARERTKAEVYEITGFSDIVRGHSAPSETATAQQIKGQFATLRLSDWQRAFQSFARDNIRIMAEVIANKFQPEVIARQSGTVFEEPQDEAEFQAAVTLMKDSFAREFRIDVETDSTIAIDESLDKQSRTEFMAAVGPFLEKAFAVTQQSPFMGPLITDMLMFVVRGHKVGRGLETRIEETMQKASAAAQEAKDQGPQDPNAAQDAAKAQAEQQKVDIARMKAESEAQIAQVKAENERVAAEAKQALDAMKAQADIELQKEKLRGQNELQALKVEFDMRLKAMQAQDAEAIATIKNLTAQ